MSPLAEVKHTEEGSMTVTQHLGAPENVNPEATG